MALTIAGSDSGGGAGIQADLKTFAALGVHGACAVTCVTAQNPRRVLAVEPVKASVVRRQIEAIFAELPPVAAKTGLLYSSEIIRVVAGFFQGRKRPLLIVDPVCVATSGARLLQPSALTALMTELLPRATLVTPNLDEVEKLLGYRVECEEDMRTVARLIRREWGCAVLVKGGHLPGAGLAVDIFYDGKTELLLSSPFVRGVRTHGTGCTLSAAIAAGCARGCPLPKAVERAKQYVTQAIAQSRRVGRHAVLNHFPAR